MTPPVCAELITAVREAYEADVLVVAAAGNDAEDACYMAPANVPMVVGVGATTTGRNVWSGSNWGACVDLWAPGEDVIAAVAGSGGAGEMAKHVA